ncbi:MAG: endolytic transglycosylase MltG [Oscillatoriales cyanobacterium SM2_2_1]|nr:endolytic transglycosylase MltG [Oscillatoriales cyanobacterium SM2_2_1]
MLNLPKKKSSWFFRSLGLGVIALSLGSIGVLWLGSSPLSSEQRVRVDISSGLSHQEIAELLQRQGIIRSALALRLWLQWQALWGSDRPLRSGVYEFAATQHLPQVVATLQETRDRPVELSITIPEGWSLRQMAALFEQEGLFSAEEFLAAAQRNPQRPWLPKDIPSLEGFLFPDTYQVIVGSETPESLIAKMLDRFEEVALPLYRQQNSEVSRTLSLKDWVTLASIVERESVLDRERRRIAGVFWRRWQRGIRLEADPTVEYALQIRQTVDNPLTLEQVRTPSPYNTYLNVGLPPGAIAAPGRASLEATLEPEAGDYLFFVARYDGSHIFSRTLAEHQNAIRQVEKNLNSRPRS